MTLANAQAAANPSTGDADLPMTPYERLVDEMECYAEAKLEELDRDLRASFEQNMAFVREFAERAERVTTMRPTA